MFGIFIVQVLSSKLISSVSMMMRRGCKGRVVVIIIIGIVVVAGSGVGGP
jgi:hypothetical protein